MYIPWWYNVAGSIFSFCTCLIFVCLCEGLDLCLGINSWMLNKLSVNSGGLNSCNMLINRAGPATTLRSVKVCLKEGNESKRSVSEGEETAVRDCMNPDAEGKCYMLVNRSRNSELAEINFAQRARKLVFGWLFHRFLVLNLLLLERPHL